MTAANYISLAALAISLVMMIVNTTNISKTQRRASNSDADTEEQRVKEEAARQTAMQLTLNNIEKSLNRIENEINTVKKDCKENHDKIILLNASYKSEHKRIDEHEERFNKLEEAIRNGVKS